jgi:hypothetical protein
MQNNDGISVILEIRILVMYKRTGAEVDFRKQRNMEK